MGFCYIESWGHQKFVANSGLIVVPAYRGLGVAKQIKKAAFQLSRRRFPQAKLFGLTTGEQVMRINTSLGYVPVTFAKLTDDEEFWAGCKSCVNYAILQRTNMTKCLCTGMIYDPEAVAQQQEAAKKAAKKATKGMSLPLFKHLRHVVGATLAVCGIPVARSTMKHTANL